METEHSIVKIREINEDGLTELINLYGHLHEADDPLPSQKKINEVWQKIKNIDAIKYFGAYTQDILVSSCTITIIPNLTRGCRPYGVIENVVVHKKHRKKGYGKSVLRYALEFAWRQNCYKVMLMTGQLPEETFRFYESVGFKKGEKQAFIAKPKQNLS